MDDTDISNSWNQLAVSFFNLGSPEEEAELFATLGRLQKDRSFFTRFRDWFFTLGFALRHRRFPALDCWSKRLDAWVAHTDRYMNIVQSASPPPASWNEGTKRMELISDHLSILDSKFSMLLAVNSVLVAIAGICLTEIVYLWERWGTFQSQGELHEKWGFILLPSLCLIIWIIYRCLFNIWYGLRGFRRIVWGDLTKAKGTPAEWADEHSRYLIFSLARRTNMFRIVSHSTKNAYFIFVLLACLGLSSLYMLTRKAWKFDKQRSQSDPAAKTSPQNDGFSPKIENYIMSTEPGPTIRSMNARQHPSQIDQRRVNSRSR